MQIISFVYSNCTAVNFKVHADCFIRVFKFTHRAVNFKVRADYFRGISKYSQ